MDICHNSDLEIEPKDIEGSHRLQASRYSRDPNKRVIVVREQKAARSYAKKPNVH